REQDAARAGTREARALRHLRQRLARRLRAERADHRQPARERLHIGVAGARRFGGQGVIHRRDYVFRATLPCARRHGFHKELFAMAMDVVDYEIKGEEMQFVEVELDPGEAAIGEAGSMMYMDGGIEMDTVFGDGSAAQSGLFGKLLGAGKRLLTGESLFTTVFVNQGPGKKRVAF